MPWGGKGLKYRKELSYDCLSEIWEKFADADGKIKDNPYSMLKEVFVGHTWTPVCIDVPIMNYIGKTFLVKFRRDFYIVQSGTRYSVTPSIKKIVEKYINED